MASSAPWEYDLSDVQEEDLRKSLVYIARTAEAAERYDDMSRYMKKLVQQIGAKEDLTVEERNLLSVAYKNVIGARRASWRTLSLFSVSEPFKYPDQHSPTLSESNAHKVNDEYKAQVERELDEICTDVLDLLENVLIKSDPDELKDDKGKKEAQVFYLKMAGDYYRYRAESVAGKGYDQKAAEFYKQAADLAAVVLDATHPIRLGLALNQSVCYYEILKDKTLACELAKSAFDEAISKLDKLSEDDYKDSTLIMQLLRDNLTLWTSEGGNDEE